MGKTMRFAFIFFVLSAILCLGACDMGNDSSEESKTAVASEASNTEEEVLTQFIPVTFRFSGFKTDTGDTTEEYPSIYNGNIEKSSDNIEISDLIFKSSGSECLQSFNIHYKQSGDYTFSIGGKQFKSSISYKNNKPSLDAYYLSDYFLRKCLTTILDN